MKNKLRGVRPSHDIIVEFTNECAAMGGAELRIREIKEDQVKIQKRLTELKLELDESRRQESQNGSADSKETTSLAAVPDMDGLTQ